MYCSISIILVYFVVYHDEQRRAALESALEDGMAAHMELGLSLDNNTRSLLAVSHLHDNGISKMVSLILWTQASRNLVESYSGRTPASDLQPATAEIDPPRFDGITTELSTIEHSMQNPVNVSGIVTRSKPTHCRGLTAFKVRNSLFVEDPFNMDTIMDISFDNFLFNSGQEDPQHYI